MSRQRQQLEPFSAPPAGTGASTAADDADAMVDDAHGALDEAAEQELIDAIMGGEDPPATTASAAAPAAAATAEAGAPTKPQFDVLRRVVVPGSKSKEFRSVPIPPHRLTPLKKEWLKIYTPLVEHLKLQVRMNVKRKTVELRTCKDTIDSGALQKGADFVRAFSLGFEIADAMALIRLDDLFMETFETKDVRTLHGDNLSRAIGRIVGKDGRTRHAIENASRTRIVVADAKIHILGGFANTRIARDAICSLILGASPGKVYTKLRTIASRQKERF